MSMIPAPSPNGNATSLAALKERTRGLPPDTPLSFFSAGGLDLMQRAAFLLSNSTLVPEAYRKTVVDKKSNAVVENPNAISNCVLALNMANRLGADPLMIMQHLYIVDGHPGWSSQFVISAINTCGKYSPLRFAIEDRGETDATYEEVVGWDKLPNGKSRPRKEKKTVKIRDKVCYAWAIEKATGERLEGPEVSMAMAVAEGWYSKTGSKWQTMPDVMLRYRAASFFGKLYAPELLMGLATAEEAQDAVITVAPAANGVYEMTVDELAASPKNAEQAEKPERKPRRKARAESAKVENAPDNPQPESAGSEAAPAGVVENTDGHQESAPDNAVQEEAGAGEEIDVDGGYEPEPPEGSGEEAPPKPVSYLCPKSNDAYGLPRRVTAYECEQCVEKQGCPEYWPPDSAAREQASMLG